MAAAPRLRTLLVPLLFALTAPAIAHTPPIDVPAGATIPAALLDALRAGGHVIYLRHAATDHDTVDTDRENLANCETQRNLSAEGRRQATAIGEAFRALSVPVGTVLSSPYCRCRDTARLAFGRVADDPDLIFALDRGAAETRRLADALRHLLSEAPGDGTNTVISGHTVNLREASGVWPKPEGAAIVFRPDGQGGFVAVASIHPNAWPQTAKAR